MVIWGNLDEAALDEAALDEAGLDEARLDEARPWRGAAVETGKPPTP